MQDFFPDAKYHARPKGKPKEQTMATATVTLRLDEGIHARVRNLAAARRRTPHGMMKEAIATYLDYEEEDEAFKQRALAAWQQYQEDGLHLTHEEMGAWLEQLAQAGDDAPEPEFHR